MTGRIGKPAAARSRSPASPTPWAGARSADWPISSPPTWASAALRLTALRVSDAPNVATYEGLKAVQMFEAIERGEIKAPWVMATNPAMSPRAGSVRNALAKLDLFEVSENVPSNDTVNAGAHLLLPARGREGRHRHQFGAAVHRASSCRCRARRCRIRWMAAQVAQLGFGDAFNYASAADIFPRARRAVGIRKRRHARFRYRRAGGIERRSLQRAGAGAMAGAAWRHAGRHALFCARRLLHPRPQGAADRTGSGVQVAVSERFPFRLNTGRVRDQ